jgi:DNA polymerase-3 subunit epsilon
MLQSARPAPAARQRRYFSASDDSEKKLSPPIALIFDTETSHSHDFIFPAQDPRQPNLVQLGMMLVDTSDWKCHLKIVLLIDGVQPGARSVHDYQKFGVSRSIAMQLFDNACLKADVLVAHNLAFDRTIMETALYRNGAGRQHMDGMSQLQHICTMQSCTEILKLPGKWEKLKWPTLQESYSYFSVDDGKSSIIEELHDALVDTEACLAVFRGLVEGGHVCKPKEDRPLTAMQTTNPGELFVEIFSDYCWVKGNTYKYRDSIKSLDGKWVPEERGSWFTLAAMREVRRLVGPELVLLQDSARSLRRYKLILTLVAYREEMSSQ